MSSKKPTELTAKIYKEIWNHLIEIFHSFSDQNSAKLKNKDQHFQPGHTISKPCLFKSPISCHPCWLEGGREGGMGREPPLEISSNIVVLEDIHLLKGTGTVNKIHTPNCWSWDNTNNWITTPQQLCHRKRRTTVIAYDTSRHKWKTQNTKNFL